ncbi:MAG: hypothetical protein RR954_10270 [Christensenellaceae bacterium]
MNKFKNALLNEILAHELSLGNTIIAQETAWSSIDLVIRLKNPLDRAFCEQQVSKSGKLAHSFETNDTHNGKEYGIVCKKESITAKK